MNQRTSRSVTLTVLVCALGIGTWLSAGPLDPPAGPVTGTHKTLTEIEPRIVINAVNTPGDVDSLFRITQPGSYYLTGQVQGVATKHGIQIAADQVTIDLRGFTLQGVTGSLSGIIHEGGAENVTVRSGIVKDWDGAGVDLGTSGTGNTVEAVYADDNGTVGIRVSDAGVVRSCVARQNELHNIVGSKSCIIESCIAEDSVSGSGIIVADRGNMVRACTVLRNSTGGIVTQDGCSVIACNAFTNGLDGIAAGTGCTITDCSAIDNAGDGISTLGASTVSTCTVTGNDADGINAGAGCTVTGCTAGSNTGDGIEVLSDSTVLNNTSRANGTTATLGAGVRVTATGNVVDGNTLDGNRFGVTVPGTRNLIFRNRCRANVNANFDIGVDNYYGPIVNRVNVATAFASGNSAASTLATADPHSNFAY